MVKNRIKSDLSELNKRKKNSNIEEMRSLIGFLPCYLHLKMQTKGLTYDLGNYESLSYSQGKTWLRARSEAA